METFSELFEKNKSSFFDEMSDRFQNLDLHHFLNSFADTPYISNSVFRQNARYMRRYEKLPIAGDFLSSYTKVEACCVSKYSRSLIFKSWRQENHHNG
jgi:hypothetical protein